MTPFLLASSSPRRRDLLSALGIPFTVIEPDVDETPLPGETPEAHVLRLALAKAEAVPRPADRIVLAADTVVALGDVIYGKPGTPERAREMLAELAGRTHTVWTGLALLFPGGGRSLTATASQVSFRTLDQAVLDAYLVSEQVSGCAGAYRIQGRGALLVERVDGSWTNVVGLPLETLARECRSGNHDLLA